MKKNSSKQPLYLLQFMIWTAPDRQSQRNGFSEQSMATEAAKAMKANESY